MAVAILGGELLQRSDLERKLAKFDADNDGSLSFGEFETWWAAHEAEEALRLEQTWAAGQVLS